MSVSYDLPTRERTVSAFVCSRRLDAPPRDLWDSCVHVDNDMRNAAVRLMSCYFLAKVYQICKSSYMSHTMPDTRAVLYRQSFCSLCSKGMSQSYFALHFLARILLI